MGEMSGHAAALHRLLKNGHACLRVQTDEEDEARRACVEAAMQLSWPMLVWEAGGGLQDGLVADVPPVPNTASAEAAFRYLAQAPTSVLMVALDAAPHLRDDPRALRAWRALMQRLAENGDGRARGGLVMIDSSDAFPDIVRAYSTCVDLPLPTGEEVMATIRAALRAVHRQKAVDVKLRSSELEVIQSSLQGLSRRQIDRLIRDTVMDDYRLDADDIAAVLTAKRRLLQDLGPLEPVEAPASLDDIGGLANLKGWLARRQRALSREAGAFGLDAPRGVLLLGVQGAGKSLCAKAIATAWHRPLLRLDAGALYDKFIGESEKRLRDALRQAEAMAPVVLWIDEIEKAFAGAASQSSDGGLSRRMFGALLTWMQEHRAPVFLVATANDIEALPPELLRKGRFDEIFFVDLPSADVRRQIFAIHLKKRKRDPGTFDLGAAAAASEGFSGAEIEQCVVSALYEAFAGGRELTTADLVKVAKNSPPLSKTRAEQIEALREWGRQRCVPAD